MPARARARRAQRPVLDRFPRLPPRRAAIKARPSQAPALANRDAPLLAPSILQAHPPPVLPVSSFSVSQVPPSLGWHEAPPSGSTMQLKQVGHCTFPQGLVVHSPVARVQ